MVAGITLKKAYIDSSVALVHLAPFPLSVKAEMTFAPLFTAAFGVSPKISIEA